MNTVITSAEALLGASKKIVAEKGIKAINIRSVAEEANVSVGSVYNYFKNKEALVSETIADIWCDVFHSAQGCTHFESFHDCLIWLISMIEKCCSEYPDILTAHPHSFQEKEGLVKGRMMMEKYLTHIHDHLKKVLEKDKKIKEGIFDEDFTMDELIDFTFSNITLCAKSNNKNYTTFIKLIDKLLYE